MDLLAPYREIWLADFEFCQPPGHNPSPLCLVAHEVRTGQTLRLWADDLSRSAIEVKLSSRIG